MRNTLQYNGTSYDGSRIKSAQAAVDTSLNERALDVDTMTATVQSQTSLAEFSQNEPVYFLRGGSQYALWYLKEVKRVAPDLWALSMMSSLGRLSQMAHKGGIYNGVSAGSIIDDICGVVPHFVGAAFADVLLYGYLPYVSPSGENGAPAGSAKDNLLKVLFAINATVRDDAQGTLRIENLSTAVSSTLDADRIYRDNAIVRHEPPVTSVTVLEHQYISGGEQTTLFEGATTAGQVIVFREPMSNLAATGFSILESGANYAIVSAGTGTLTGRKYIHTTREITRSVTAAPIPNPARIEDATLVGITNSGDVANRLAAYYAHRTYIECDATIEFEDAGDVVSILDPYDKVQRDACIEKISPLIASQTMKGRISALVGFTPWQVMQFEDEQIIVSSDSTVTLPEGVTDVSAVLIGGGNGGNGGFAGAQGNNGASATASSGNSRSGNGGRGGKGGNGGSGGAGGKVFRIDLTSIPNNRQLECHIGAGGSGGAAEGGAGTEGSPSTMKAGDTLFSSDSGAASAVGYQDPVSLNFYAKSGDPGLAGGKGGDGISGMDEDGNADTTSSAENGAAVGTHTGGNGQKGFQFEGGYGIVSYKNPSSWEPVSSGNIPSGTTYSGGTSYSLDRTTGRYSTSGNTSGTVYKGMPQTIVYSASGQTLTESTYNWSSLSSSPTRIVRKITSVPVYGTIWTKCYGGSGGGGASGAANGSNAVIGNASTPGTGGAGARGGSRSAAVIYGNGGSGGHGGGGGGGGGGSAIWTKSNAGSSTCDGGSGGAAGAGGSGGAGAAGCIILYYRKPVTD